MTSLRARLACSRRRLLRPLVAGAGASLAAAMAFMALLGAASPSGAGAASLYWTHESKPLRLAGSIEAAALGGGGPRTLFAQPDGSSPEGIALDPGKGEVYWAEGGAGEILAGSIAGSASSGGERALIGGQSGPSGVAVDPISEKLYWADSGSGSIMSANIDGTEVSTLYTGEAKPTGIAVDPATGRLYWVDSSSGEIRQGGIEGAQAGEPKTLYEGESGPVGIALDIAAGRLYWTDATAGEVRAGSVQGSEAQQAVTLYGGQSVPLGIAIDEQEEELYWASFGSGAIQSASLSGSAPGPAGTALTTGEEGPSFLALLSAPKAGSIPAITGSARIGGTLSCGGGEWEADLPGASFYQAPEALSYRWTRNGYAIPQASGPTLLVGSEGSYVCEVTASNAAGQTTATSVAVTVKPAAGAQSPRPAAGTLGVRARRVVARAGRVSVKVACPGPVACEGRLALLADVRRRIVAGGGKRISRVLDTRGVTLGRARYDLRAGTEGTVRLRLSGRAMRMLRGASGHRLEAWALAIPTEGRAQAPLLIALEAHLRHHRHRAHNRHSAHHGHRAHNRHSARRRHGAHRRHSARRRRHGAHSHRSLAHHRRSTSRSQGHG